MLRRSLPATRTAFTYGLAGGMPARIGAVKRSSINDVRYHYKFKLWKVTPPIKPATDAVDRRTAHSHAVFRKPTHGGLASGAQENKETHRRRTLMSRTRAAPAT